MCEGNNEWMKVEKKIIILIENILIICVIRNTMIMWRK